MTVHGDCLIPTITMTGLVVLYNAANTLRNKSGKGKPDTAFVDIRNKNKYVAKTYQEEMEFEIRTWL